MDSYGVDLEIISAVLKGNEVDDAQADIEIIEESQELIAIKNTAADGAYDKKKFDKFIHLVDTELYLSSSGTEGIEERKRLS